MIMECFVCEDIVSLITSNAIIEQSFAKMKGNISVNWDSFDVCTLSSYYLCLCLST